MADLAFKAAMIVGLTHGMRAVGSWLGPRAGGLLMGLPCTTAVTLYFLGREQGAGFAAGAAGAGLLGLTGAVAAALVYAQAASEQRGPVLALSAAVAAYFLPVAALRGAGRVEPVDAAVLCAALIVAAAHLSRRAADGAARHAAAAPSRAARLRSLALRTFVPAAFLLGLTSAANSLGSMAAGLLSTFPAMFLAVTLVTHIEGGGADASHTAAAYVPGNLAMVAFLWVVATATPRLGLGGAFVLAYAASLAALAAVSAAPQLGPRALKFGGRVPREA